MIVTLSSIPPRFGELGPVLHSMLRQRLPAEQIILYIPRRYRRFPEWDGALPDVPEGISLRLVDEDYGPATKVLPAVREFVGHHVDILFGDDDMIYDSRWTQRFSEMRKRHPTACITESAYDFPNVAPELRPADRRPRIAAGTRSWPERIAGTFRHRRRVRKRFEDSGYADILLGYAGALVRPAFFGDEAFDIPDILWTVDDVWLSGHLEVNGIPIWNNGDTPRRRRHRSACTEALLTMVYKGHGRREASLAGMAYFRQKYGIWSVCTLMP
jgi:hypothetical protein